MAELGRADRKILDILQRQGLKLVTTGRTSTRERFNWPLAAELTKQAA